MKRIAWRNLKRGLNNNFIFKTERVQNIFKGLDQF